MARPEKIYFIHTKDEVAAINFDDNFIYADFNLAKEERKLPTVLLLKIEALIAFSQRQKSTNEKILVAIN